LIGISLFLGSTESGDSISDFMQYASHSSSVITQSKLVLLNKVAYSKYL
jgi:hypothetical protein